MGQFERGKRVQVKSVKFRRREHGAIRYRQELEKEVAKHFLHWWLLFDFWSNKRYVDSEISKNPFREFEETEHQNRNTGIYECSKHQLKDKYSSHEGISENGGDF